MLNSFHSNHLRLLLGGVLALSLTAGCGTGAIGTEGACASFTCEGNEGFPGYQQDDPQSTRARNMHKLRQAELEAQRAEFQAQQAQFQAQQAQQRALQQAQQQQPAQQGSATTATTTFEAHCCLNGQFFDCPTAAAADACFEDFEPGACTPDFARDAECE